LRPMNEFGLPSVVNSYFCAEIDETECNGCGICVDERCQVKAIENVDEIYRVIKERCIGCGLCVTECPTDAIRLIPKPPAEIMVPPDDVAAWNEERALQRGIDYRTYRYRPFSAAGGALAVHGAASGSRCAALSRTIARSPEKSRPTLPDLAAADAAA
jgi:ferredoxin